AKIGDALAKLNALAEPLAKQKAELEAVKAEVNELKAALNTLVDLVQSIVPPRKSKTVLDTAGEGKPYKWGLFQRTK
ncbi:MAG: hypothetical protein NZ651_06245, partial [Candidatus Bipolaricaulota bacterium]|nr:hypothetical protein [Candidatus Bipolaricaulota bacterium]MDW8127354.1 hypothetical protein [Candidatus Bipolaricaulota bacterium]